MDNITNENGQRFVRDLNSQPREKWAGHWRSGRLYPLYNVVENNGSIFVSLNGKMKKEPYVVYDETTGEFTANDGWRLKQLSADSRETARGGGGGGGVTPSEIEELISGKVDKIPGKGLSTNDYDNSEKGKVANAYRKPNTGIPKTDLADAVQTSLGKADTAYQKPSEGIAWSDLADGIQDSLSNADSAYQKPSSGIPASDLASGVIPTVPTISTDVSADAASDVKTSSPKSVKTYVDAGIAAVESDLADLADEVEAIDIGAYVVAWDGESSPVVANIPAGVVVTYGGTDYTGTLAASASTIQKIYLVATGTTDNYDRHITVGDSTYSWVNIGTTEITLADYAAKTELSQLDLKVGDLETSSQELEDAVFGELKTLIFTRGSSTAQCNFIQGHIYKCTFARYTPYATESPRSMKLTLSGDGVPSAYIPTESGVELNYGESYYFYSPNDYTGATGYTEGTAEWDIRDITEQFEDVFRMMRDSEYVANGSVQYDSLGLIIQEAVVWSNGCSGVLTRTAFDGDVFEYTKEEVTCVNAVAGKFTYKATFDKSYDEFGNIVNESVTIAKI